MRGGRKSIWSLFTLKKLSRSNFNFRFVKSRQCSRVLRWKKIIGGSWGRVTWVTLRLKNLVTDVILVWDALVVPGPGLERPPLIWASFIHRRSGQIFLIAAIKGRMLPPKRMNFRKSSERPFTPRTPNFIQFFRAQKALFKGPKSATSIFGLKMPSPSSLELFRKFICFVRPPVP